MGPERGPSLPDARLSVRVSGCILLVGTLAILAWLTLGPAPSGSRLRSGPLCILCGDLGLANLFRNVLLFLPLGFSLGLISRRPTSAWVWATLGSVVIEFLQIWIPGRNPLLVDLLANSSGAAMGIVLARATRWRTKVRRPQWTRSVLHPAPWIAVNLLTLALTAFLLTPSSTSAPVWIQWAPKLDHLGEYRGVIESLRLDERPLPPGRVPVTPALTTPLFGGGNLVLEGRHEGGAPDMAPLLRIMGEDAREVILLAWAGGDAVLHLPYRAERLGLARPDLRAKGAFRSVAPGETWALTYRQEGPGACLLVDGVGSCGLRASLGEGWALLLFSHRMPPQYRTLLSAVWLILLALPPSYLARSRREVLVAGGAVLMGSSLIGAFPGQGPGLPAWQSGALLLGVLLGSLLRLRARRCESGT